MNSGLKLIAAVVVGAITSLPSTSRADVIRTFDLSGQFVYPASSGNQPYQPLGGTVTIDTDTGTVLSQTSFAPISPQEPIVVTQGYSSTAKAYRLNLYGQIYFADLYFNTPSLVNYTGGSLASLAAPTPAGTVSSFGAQLAPLNIVLSVGTATLEPVPEPGSMPLLVAGIGSLALLGLVRRRRQ